MIRNENSRLAGATKDVGKTQKPAKWVDEQLRAYAAAASGLHASVRDEFTAATFGSDLRSMVRQQSFLHHASCHLLSASSVVFSATGVVLPASCHLLSATGVVSSASCLMPPAFSSNVVLSATGMVNSPPSMQWASAVDTSPAALLFARPKISAACPVAVGAQVRREVQGRGAAW